MKKTNKIISIICVLAMLFASFATFSVTVSAAAYTPETPVDSSQWVEPDFNDDYAYSFCFVGDTQYITCGDYYNGTEKLKYQYKVIADTAEERKLEHVFILGDIVDLGYKNDKNLAGSETYKSGDGEWTIAQTAINQLNGVVPYSITRGNHDDYAIDRFFNVSSYTSQFSGCGGFYSDSNANYKGVSGYSSSRVPANTGGYVYWDGVKGTHHTSSMVNSWKTVTIGGIDYLFITVDFNPTDNVLNWVDEKLTEYPNHRAIITTHSYLLGNGTVNTSDAGSTMYLFGNTGEVLWNEVLSQHKNVFMVVSGHTGGHNVTYSYNTGTNGNKVLQVLCDPQAYDAKEAYYDHDSDSSTSDIFGIEHGIQDTGLVLYMNFSEDGKTISFDYYSTLLNKMKKGNAITIDVEATHGKTVDLSSLEAYGQKNQYVSFKSEFAPSYADGKVTTGEYPFSRVTKAADASNQPFDGDLTEYYAYDDDYVYYAFSVKQEDTTHEYQFNIKPNYDWESYNTLAANIYPRMKIGFKMSSEGVLSNIAATRVTPASKVVYSLPVPSVGTASTNDICMNGTRDTNTSVNTFEFRISRAYIEAWDPVNKDLNCIAYLLFLGYKNGDASSTANEIWHRWTGTSAAISAFTADGYTGGSVWMYQYMKFEDNSPVNTLDSGSVRISSTNSGLRFKTQITADMDYFTTNYSTVKVGTLIAPTNLLAGKALTHAIGTAGTDYIDVVATVDKPFDYNETTGITTYAGSITSINPNNLGRDFTAVGYICLDGTYYYSENATVRNVSEIAEAALGDISATRTEDTETARGYDNALDGFFTGYYSKYTAGERAIITALIADTSKNDPFETSPY